MTKNTLFYYVIFTGLGTVLNVVLAIAIDQCVFKKCAKTMQTVMTVSYTHLDVYKRQVLQFTDGLKKAHRRNGFVSLSFPQAPVTLFIILCYFESPASTFGFVKAIRLRALP